MSTETTKGSWSRVTDKDAYDKTHEEIYGVRCIKHPSVKVDEYGMCERCNQIHWDKIINQGEWK